MSDRTIGQIVQAEIDQLRAENKRLREALEEATAFKPTHRHFKGGLYQVIDRAPLADDKYLSPIVMYRDAKGNVWARYADNFDQYLDANTRRFEPLAQQEPTHD